MYRIVTLTEEYIESLVELENLCFDEPWTKGMFVGDLSSEYTCYFAAIDDDNKVVGYAGMWISVDEGQITNVAVHPDFRRKNIATELLSRLFDVCRKRGLQSITLEVRQSNEKAINLYEKNGFLSVGMRKNYYKNPAENAVLMTKTFND